MSHLTNLVKRHRVVFTDKFMAWFPDNEHVYLLFEYLADKLWASGKQHYSSRTIGEKMRFDYGIVSVNDTFKINNIYTPDLGRLYVLKHPERMMLFSYRKQRQPDFVEYVCKKFGLTIVPAEIFRRKK